MRMPLCKVALGVFTFLGIGTAATADDYVIDTAHSGVTFKISHLGLSHIFGRFNEFTGGFALDAGDAAKSSFKLDIKSQSVDTNNSATTICAALTFSTSSSFLPLTLPARPSSRLKGVMKSLAT